jgi:hypothetical protein
VPKSAFGDAARLARFEALSEEAIRHAQLERVEEQAMPRRPLVETGNPYQPPGL